MKNKPPQFLDKVGQELYKKLWADDINEYLLQVFCAAYSVFVLATEAITEHGILVQSAADTLKHNPALSAQKQATETIIKTAPLLAGEKSGELSAEILEIMGTIKK